MKKNPEQGRIVPELKIFGNRYREIIVTPWRIIYTIDSKEVVVLFIIDGRRDLEEVLYERIVNIDNYKN